MMCFSGKRVTGLCFVAAIAFLCARVHAAATWTNTGSMGTARSNHIAVLLQNGKVLVAGGQNSGGILASAELFDPATGTWGATGSMGTGRCSAPMASLLPNGKVLAAGGRNSSGTTVATAEVYDPGAGTWSATNSMSIAREQGGAVLLKNGKVLVAGGWKTGGPYLASAELYDPATGTWTSTGNLNAVRSIFAMTLLPDGRALAVSGTNGDGSYVATNEVYDPSAGTWSNTGSLTGTTRIRTPIVVLPNGKVLIAGGYHQWSVNSCDLYDPTGGTCSSTGTLGTDRNFHTLTLLPNGMVLAVAGRQGGNTGLTSCELYNPAGGTWSATASMNNKRLQHTATLLPSGRVLVAGGDDYSGTTYASCEVYSYAAGSWSAGSNRLTAAAGSIAITLPNGKVLVTGGAVASDTGTNACELYDPATGSWSATGNMQTARYGHRGVLLPNGNVLVAGGVRTNPVGSAEIYDPALGTWSAAPSIPYEYAGYFMVLLDTGKVLIAGGRGTQYSPEDYHKLCFLYDPAANTWSATGSNTESHNGGGCVKLPDGKVLLAAGEALIAQGATDICEIYDPATGQWSAVAPYPAGKRSGLHCALLPNGKVLAMGGQLGPPTYADCYLYDPSTNAWAATGSLPGTSRVYKSVLLKDGRLLVPCYDNNTTTSLIYDPASGAFSVTGSTTVVLTGYPILLPDGRVLELDQSGAYDTLCNIYDPGFGFQNSWQPIINTATSPLAISGKLTLAGSKFRGISNGGQGSADSGNTSSSSDFPLVQLRSMVSSQSAFLRADPSSSWSDTSFTSAPVSGFPSGYAQVTVFTNGIPSVAKTILISDSAPSITSALTANGTVNQAFSYTITASNNPTSFNATNLPAGLSFSSPTISGTPTTAGATDVTISATNAGGTTYATLQITISATGTVSTPTFSPAAGTYSSAQSVTITCATSGAAIYCTTDGSTPTTGSPQYTGAINVATNTTIKAIATKATFTDSAVASATYTISIPTPAITSATSASGSVGDAFTYQITATNSPTSYGCTNQPAWLTMINTSTGAISGTPDVAGTWDVTISATNAGGTGSARLTITIASKAPAITSELTATGTVRQSFSYGITATGATPIAFEAAPLPAGLSLSAGVISGTPTTAGTVNVTLKATNSFGNDTKTLQITINPVGAPTITGTLQATGQVGQTFTYKITASGNATITYSATNLPPGLTTSGNMISGTPNTVGQTNATISASNGLGTDTKTLVITINAPGAPTIISELTDDARATNAYTYTIAATGNGPITYSSSNLPAWLTGNGADLSGTPQNSDVGTFAVTITATNAAGSDSKQLKIKVAPANSEPPVVTDIDRSRNPVRTNTDVTFTATGVAPSGQPLTYKWFFFDSGSKQVGDPMAGVSVTCAFPLEGTYTVVAVGNDGFRDSTNFTKVSVTLAPNSGSDQKSVCEGHEAVNPDGGLGVSVPASMGGVVDLDLVEQAGAAPDPNEKFKTKVPGLQDEFDGRALAGKGTVSRIFVVETTGTRTGGQTRKARIMVPVGRHETGEATMVVDLRANKGLVTFDMKGKFNFGKRADGVTLKTEIELPAGLTPSQGMPISLGIGNVTGNGMVDARGRVTGLTSGALKKVQVKWPRMAKGTTATSGGEKAKVTIMLYGSSLHAAGFDTEGIVNTGLTEKQAVPRSIQTAIVLGGVSYYAQAQVNYTLKKGTGMLQGRTER